MATMKFLSVFDGNVNYQDSAGTGTLTNDGAQTYATSFWAGHQGLVTPEVVTLPSVANAAVPTAGSIVMRLKAPASFGSFYVMAGFGPFAAPYLYLRFDPTSGQFTVVGQPNSGGGMTLATGQNATASANTFVYAEWSATGVKAALGTNALVAYVAANKSWFPATNYLKIGGNPGTNADYPAGRIDAVAIFDQPLTNAQRFYLAGVTTPWTWGMALSAPIAGYIDVLPSAGANTDAPVLTLP